ncbi:secreted protein [Nannizzia gypsea CBS 118893]|uniref:Secreted protein n=1 Tax=Arthroderma gypseum (strain ATCC MYA-4604 / CBS 118893) TaxID=535722 RepID=E4UST0_ARTGP|nr:secreted protein [Nannizzia gypsea CBS 118893]EFR00595.1 secreted protein [Nannizzia gypsea CBS 118893]
MKKLSFLLGLASIFSASFAASDYTCAGRDSPKLPGSAYRLKESIDWNLSTLRKHFSDRGKLATVSDVLDSANHQLIKLDARGWASVTRVTAVPQSVYRWESTTEGFDDFGTKKWYPQGVTSSSDAFQVGTYEGRNAWIMSWYDDTDGKESVRVTFVDKKTGKYRHALLVVPNTPELYSGTPSPATDFKRLGIHAGGIVWYGSTLWVVDTSKGIRVFDLNNIWQVEAGDEVGKMSNGQFSAQGYLYVIPQIRTYTWTPKTEKEKFRFSWISLDRVGTDKILVGEYAGSTTPDSTPIRMAQYELDYTVRKLQTSSQIATSSWAYCVDILEMQGAISHGDKFYISTSNPNYGLGDLWTWTPGNRARESRAWLPPGPEDMTWDEVTQTFTTISEHPGKRFIVTYKGTQAPF